MKIPCWSQEGEQNEHLKYLRARWIFFKYQSSQKIDQFYK